jgi:hypothetical protein
MQCLLIDRLILSKGNRVRHSKRKPESKIVNILKVLSVRECNLWKRLQSGRGLIYGTVQAPLSLHSTSRGRSQGNQTGTGFSDRQGAGTSTCLPPGRHTEAFPKLTHGRMWNSVLIRVGHMGRSNGTDTGPTLSGGMGRSGAQRAYGSPA